MEGVGCVEGMGCVEGWDVWGGDGIVVTQSHTGDLVGHQGKVGGKERKEKGED